MAQNTSSNRPVYLVLILLLLGGLALYLWPKEPEISWVETYQPEDKQPYGCYAFHELLKDIRGKQAETDIVEFAHDNLPEDPTSEVDNYLFIGSENYADSLDLVQIKKFIEAGNRAFLICENPQHRLLDSLIDASLTEDEYILEEEDMSTFSEHIYSTIVDSTIEVSLANDTSSISISHVDDFLTVNGYWTILRDSLKSYDGKPCEVLGMMHYHGTNFIKIPIGKGELYLHTTPLLFTNYFMLRKDVMNYCRSVAQHMGTGKIYWDEENRRYDPGAFAKNDEVYPPEEGPLEFILSERSLRTAWYLILLTGMLYLLFGAKRAQRIIPINEKLDNSSIEYAEVISQLFMKQSDHHKLIRLKMDLLKSHLRERYAIRLPLDMREEDDRLYKEISQRSRVPQKLVQSIFEEYKYLGSISFVDTATMLPFHHKIEQFYALSK